MSRSLWLLPFIVLPLALSCDDKSNANTSHSEFQIDRKTYDSIVSRAFVVDVDSSEFVSDSGMLLDDGTKRFRYSNYEMNYLPAKEFLFRENIYRPDGTIFMSYSDIFDVPVGQMDTYDEKGVVCEKTDWSSEYRGCKVDPYMLADFLETEGWYDRSTGFSYLGHDEALSMNGDFTFRVFNNVIVDFIPSWDSLSSPSWVVVLLNVNGIPSRFLEKHGVVGEDGKLSLVDSVTRREGEGALRFVSYYVDAVSGKYDVKWEFSGKK